MSRIPRLAHPATRMSQVSQTRKPSIPTLQILRPNSPLKLSETTNSSIRRNSPRLPQSSYPSPSLSPSSSHAHSFPAPRSKTHAHLPSQTVPGQEPLPMQTSGTAFMPHRERIHARPSLLVRTRRHASRPRDAIGAAIWRLNWHAELLVCAFQERAERQILRGRGCGWCWILSSYYLLTYQIVISWG